MSHDLNDLFIDELEDMFSSEQQIIEALPKMIKLASTPDLKEALTDHLHETENQFSRLKKVFSIIKHSPKAVTCEAMEGLIDEANELTENKPKSAGLDAAIIVAAQKIEHYEMASYGALRSFAKQLDLGSEVVDLLQETLNEEGNADKKLTKIAEGSMFFSGVNKNAA